MIMKKKMTSFRIKVKPIKSDKLVEVLIYEVLPINADEGKLKMSWEHMSVELP